MKYFSIIFSIFMLFISSLGLSSCAATSNYQVKPKPPINSNSTMSGRWFLTSLNNAGYQGPRITLQFNENNRVSGFSGCNRYFASNNRQTNGNLNFGSIGSTRKLCVDRQSNQLESYYLNALKQIRSYQLNGNRLVLKGHSTHLVFFRKGMK
ncbi:MAG TPA: META domain-containing protein [Leucothrix sp.]|nr:META domain-containing protein [Leucothrix sp.]